MDIDALSTSESAAIGRVLHYWTEHWDSECPTLFGLELPELRSVSEAWPVVQDQSLAEIAVVGSMREFVWGASAIPEEAVLSECGLSYEEACGLLERLISRRGEGEGSGGRSV
jgi:hypothetical protein